MNLQLVRMPIFFNHIDESFILKKYAKEIKYLKKNDQSYFYNLIKKIDPRASKNSFWSKIKKIFSKFYTNN